MMNAHALSLHRPIDGPARAQFTVEDIERMVDAELLDRDLSIELLDGELILMPSEGELHVTIKSLLTRLLNRLLDDEWLVVPDSPLILSEIDAPEPDICVRRAKTSFRPTSPESVALVIELSDSSLGHDLGRKAAKCAQYLIAEYWVVDLKSRQTHVLTRPADGVYHDIKTAPFDQTLSATTLSQIRVLLADLER